MNIFRFIRTTFLTDRQRMSSSLCIVVCWLYVLWKSYTKYKRKCKEKQKSVDL